MAIAIGSSVVGASNAGDEVIDRFEGCSVQGSRVCLSDGTVILLLSAPEAIPTKTDRFRALVRQGNTVQLIEIPVFVVLAWEIAGGEIAS